MVKDRAVLISGRFDDVHTGHIRTIQLLGQQFRKVIVVILDYPTQEFPLEYRFTQLRDILDNSKGNYEVVANKIHFGSITEVELNKYEFDVYAAGNLNVLKHIESMGHEVIWTDRPYDKNATDSRLAKRMREIRG